MFGLEDKYTVFLKETLKKYIQDPEAKFYIFGSRAKGEYGKYSDVDIAIDTPYGLTCEQKLKLKTDFENSTFLYEVDIVDLKNIKESFKTRIIGDLIPLV